MFAQVTALAAAAGLISAGLVSASETRAFEAMPALLSSGAASAAGSDNLCRIDVVRSGSPGKALVTRSEDGDRCVCTVTTGPQAGNGSAEAVVNTLLRERTCDGAPPPALETAARSGGIGTGAILGVVLAAGVGAGLTAGQGSDSNG